MNNITKITGFLDRYGIEYTVTGNQLSLRRSKYKYIFPDPLTEDMAYLVGVISGDGSLVTPIKRSRGGYIFRVSIAVARDNQEFLDNILQLLKKLFGINPTLVKKMRNGSLSCYEILIQLVPIYAYFVDVIGLEIGRRDENFQVPEIFQNKRLFPFYLAGMIDTDGHVQNNRFRLDQKNYNMIQQIRELTLKFITNNVSELKEWYATYKGKKFKNYYFSFAKIKLPSRNPLKI